MFGYSLLVKSSGDNEKLERGAAFLMGSNRLYIGATLTTFLIALLHTFGADWILLVIIVSLIIVHWVLFFIGWGKVLSSLDTPPQETSQIK